MVEEWHRKFAGTFPHMPSLRMGIGIHKGKATMGILSNDQRIEFIAFGNSVNVTQRIESAAGRGDGDVLVTQSVRGLIEAKYLCDLERRFSVKDGYVYAAALRGPRDTPSGGSEPTLSQVGSAPADL